MADRQDNWSAFLYLLIRDEVPLGKVAEIIQTIEKKPIGPYQFTNNGLAMAARDFVQRMDAT